MDDDKQRLNVASWGTSVFGNVILTLECFTFCQPIAPSTLQSLTDSSVNSRNRSLLIALEVKGALSAVWYYLSMRIKINMASITEDVIAAPS